jgi:DNA-directed RNA polymerase sigma subunit (sigma70/sigma32)
MALATKQINAAKLSEPFMGPGDLFTRQVQEYDVVSAQEQLALLGTYRAGKAAGLLLPSTTSAKKRTELSSIKRDGDQALSELLGATFRLALRASNTLVNKRYGNASSEILDEAHAEAYLALLEAIDSFDETKGNSLAGFITLKVRARVRALLQGPGTDSWDKIARMAAVAEQELTSQLKRAPTLPELRAEVLRHALGWARSKLIEEGITVTGDEINELARKKMIKQGTWSAIERLDVVRVATTTPLSLDATNNESASLLDSLGANLDPDDASSVLGWFLSSLDAPDLGLITARFGIDGASPATFEDLAVQRNEDWPATRAHLAGLLGRLTAPHAQFISLDPTLETRFEYGGQDSAAKRLTARRRVSAH